MKFENVNVYNFEGALRGMRNPLNSWDKSDSVFGGEGYEDITYIGPNDMGLAKMLVNAGPEHRKFLRQIFITVDITAPIYWWKEMDTYKTGTTANSTSTMHKLTSEPIILEDFSIASDYVPELMLDDKSVGDHVESLIDFCEQLRKKYIETKDKRYWKELVRWLPEGWLQTRTWTANYEVLRNIIHQRKGHKLIEWAKFIEWCETLPYAQEFLFDNK